MARQSLPTLTILSILKWFPPYENQQTASVDAEVARISGDRSLGCMEKLHALLACLQHEMEEIQPAFVRDMQRRAPEVFALIERRRAGICLIDTKSV